MAKAPDNVPASFVKACEFIRAQGFSHVKVELEARLNRVRDYGTYCADCHGDPNTECSRCGGMGFLVRKKGHIVECPKCHGERFIECVTCNGRGYANGGSYNEAWCQAWILKNLPKEVEQSLTYAKFYYDASVDSELTFTLPVRKAYMVLDVIDTFNGLAVTIGHGLSIENAGMHISVLPEGRYPCQEGLLDKRKMANFEKQVTPLLPALYFLATHTSATRKLSFRLPRISDDQKMSAIYTRGGTSLEYRLFDPCFDKPEAFYDKLEVIAQTLKFYSYKQTKVDYKSFKLGPTQSLIKLAALYGDSDNYEALQRTIDEVKPDKTLTSLKKERSFNISKSAILRQQRKKLDDFKQQYAGYVKHEKDTLAYRVENVRATLSDWETNRFLPHPKVVYAVKASGYSTKELLSDPHIFQRFYMENCHIWGYPRPTPLMGEDEYVEARMLDMAHKLDPQYEITPAKPMDSDREDIRMVF